MKNGAWVGVVKTPPPVDVATLFPLPINAYEPNRLLALQEGDCCRISLTNVLEPYRVLTGVVVEAAVQEPVFGTVQRVPVEKFCNTPRSISDPSWRTIPCKLVEAVLFPNASFNVTVIVQLDEFSL
ncbi:MAG: hypothetical protein ACRD4E_03270 [Bryobacteraceae bacterium]